MATMKKNQDTDRSLPDTVNTFNRLTLCLEDEIELVRFALKEMYNDIMEKQRFIPDLDFLSGPVDSLDSLVDRLGKLPERHGKSALVENACFRFDWLGTEMIQRIVAITQSHIQEIAQMHPGLDLQVRIDCKSGVYFDLFENGEKVFRDIRDGTSFLDVDPERDQWGADFFHIRERKCLEELDMAYPEVSGRIGEILGTYMSCRKKGIFSNTDYSTRLKTRVFPDGTVKNAEFPQGKHATRMPEPTGEMKEEKWTGTEHGRTRINDVNQVKTGHDVDEELPEGPG